MATGFQRHANISKQATLLDGLDIRPLKWCICGCGLNVEVHLKTRSGNINLLT